MGRIVRRVASDFQWPLNIPYKGFLRSSEHRGLTCASCGGDGSSPVARELSARWWGHVPFDPSEKGSEPYTPDMPEILEYTTIKIMDARAFYDDYLGSTGDETIRREAARLCTLWNSGWAHHLSQEEVDILLADDQILQGLTHRFCSQERRWVRIDREPPSQREVNIWGLGLKGGLTQVPEYAIHKAEAERRGTTLLCETCGGDGETFRDEAHRLACENWEPTPPPEGDAWQLWETVSEGSPITPPCASAEALARLLAHEDRLREEGMGYDAWLRFIRGSGFSVTVTTFAGAVVGGHVAAAQN